MADGAGNRLQDARLVTIRPRATVFKDQVSGGDRLDYYQVNLSTRSRLKLDLKSTGGNADLELIQDRNLNGLADDGEVVASSRARTGLDSIEIVGLPAATYFVKVFPKGGGASDYQISLSARTTTAVNTAYQVVELTNTFRQTNGLLPLAMNTQLTKAAQDYSQQMALGDFFSHTGPGNSTVKTRIMKAGYPVAMWAENLGAGYGTANEVIDAWINSPSHKENLLRSSLKEIGVGVYLLTQDTGTINYNRYWTQNFGTSR